MRKKPIKNPSKNKKNAANLLFGKHACQSALANPKRDIKAIWATENTARDIKELHNHKKLSVVTSKTLNEKLPLGTVHQGIIIDTSPLPVTELDDVIANQPLIILDQVTDPQNVGAIMRSAAAFGFSAVILPKDNAPQETGTMAKIACGALERIPLVKVTNISKTIKELQKENYWCIGLDGYARDTLSQFTSKPSTHPVAVVMGAEGKGLRRLVKETCDQLIGIPMQGDMESLNVSNAAAVTMYAISQMSL